jgi:hypothetical protein
METDILLENCELFEMRPGCWEFILTVDRLERPLEEIIREARAIEPVPSSKNMPPLQSAEVLRENIAAIIEAVESLRPLMESRLIEAWGEPGQAGSVADIEEVCRWILVRCRDLANAERAILTTPMHPTFAGVRQKFQGIAADNISTVLEAVKSIRAFIAAGSTGTLNLNVRFTTDRLVDIEIPELGEIARADFLENPPAKKTQPAGSAGGGICLLVGLIALWWAWPAGVVLLLLALLFFAYADGN